jgi:hypothetical protein
MVNKAIYIKAHSDCARRHPAKRQLHAVQTTRFDESKNRALLDFSSVHARSVSAEYVSHVFELDVSARRRAQCE